MCIVAGGGFLLVVGIIFWVWFLIVLGAAVFIIGAIVHSQSQKTMSSQQSKAQTVPQQVVQPTQQQVAPPAPQPAPAQSIESAQFCPNCGAKTTGDTCSECGEIFD